MFKLKESWSLFNLTRNGKQYIVRMNSWLWNIIPHPEYLYKIGIATPLNDPNEEGFPTTQENQELQRLEDKLIDKMGNKSDSIFAGTIIGGGMKEFIFYSSDLNVAKKTFNDIKSKVRNRRLQISAEEDRNWDVFKQLCPQK